MRESALPLARLELSPKLHDQMATLGIYTLDDFLRLPASDLYVRYGEEAARLHAMASGKAWTPPPTPEPLEEPLRVEVEVEPPDYDLARLLFLLKGALHQLVEPLKASGEAIAALRLLLKLDHAPTHEDLIELAAPTLDVLQVIELVRLRLSSVQLPALVIHISAEIEHLYVHARQLELVSTPPRRDLAAAGRALARVKAAFGHGAVTCAELQKRHLPEASFRWTATSKVQFPRGGLVRSQPLPLVRLLFAKPIALSTVSTQRHGPYRISGGWWLGSVMRDYFFVETNQGAILWVYFDRRHDRWFLHGKVD